MIAVQSLDRPTLVSPALVCSAQVSSAVTQRASVEPFATITLAGTITAQGPVLRRFTDGRVEISTGRHALTGYPVAR